ncbi:MAG: hypothetical protein WC527_01315 [Candidatus Margulisiibacteriota bacterium]
MCEDNKELDVRAENEAILCEILEQYKQKNDDIYMGGEKPSLMAGFDDNDSIYSAEEYSMPQEFMAVVFLGTN